MKSASRLVIDTNLVLSALLFRQGRLTPLRRAWQLGHCLPLVCTATISELMRVLSYPKFKLSVADQHELLADYLPHCETVNLPEPLPMIPDCRDAFDRPFLHLAVAGSADALLSGDQDLLVLNGQLRCPIITAERWLTAMAESQSC